MTRILMTGLARAGYIRGRSAVAGPWAPRANPERVGPQKARTCFRLMTEPGLHGMLDEAFEVCDGLRHLWDAEGVALERSRACVNLAGFLGGAGRLAEARELCREMLEEEGRPPEADVNLAKCAFNLVCGFGKTRYFAASAEVLSGMGLLGDSGEIAAERALAGCRLILFLVDDGRVSGALAVLKGMEVLGSSDKELLGRARGTAALVLELGAAGCLEAADPSAATCVPSCHPSACAPSGAGRASGCAAALKTCDPSAAEATCASMMLLGDDDETVLIVRGCACVKLASHNCSAGARDDAGRVVSEACSLPDRVVMPVLKDKAAYNLVHELARTGLMDAARAAWRDPGLFPLPVRSGIAFGF